MTPLPLVAMVSVLAAFGAAIVARAEAPMVQVSYYTAGLERSVSPLASEPAPVATRPPAAPPDTSGLAVVRAPSVDVATIERVLRQYRSPAVGEARAIYELGERYGIDPAICLAFFVVESSAGTKGMATETLSLGNIRATPGYVNHKGYRKYATWRDGIEDWYRLIARLYVGEWNLTTVEAIVPVYAPSEDNNDPARYIRTVRTLVREWQTAR